MTKSCSKGGVWLESEIFLKRSRVRVGYRNIAGLHGYEFFMGVEIVVLWKYACADKFLLENVHKFEKVFRMAVADVVDLVGRNGKAVGAGLLLWGMLHHTDYALHNIIDVGEVALAVAVIEDFYLLTFDKFICKPE